MPCSATITARGLPCASQRRSGSLVPSRAIMESSASTGIVLLLWVGLKLGAQPVSSKRTHTTSQRTSHPDTVRLLRAGIAAQHQLADHKNVIHADTPAKRQYRASIIDDDLPRRHVRNPDLGHAPILGRP